MPDGIQIHLLLNHLPIVGLLFSFLLLGFGFWKKSVDVQKASLGALVLIGILTIPAFKSGEAAEELLEHDPTISEVLVEEHEEFAERAFWLLEGLALMALAGLISFRSGRKIPSWYSITMLVGMLAGSGMMMRTGHLGGLINHPEIRPEEATMGDARTLHPETQLAVEKAIRGLDQMRSGLAGTIGNEQVDAGTFAQVCKPVGMQAKQIAKEKGWIVRQVATKYRNPANKADSEAATLSVRFEAEADLDSLWQRTEHQDKPGWRYLRRISVESSCLACHGPKEERPEFILKGYAEDRAFDFVEGDLRGLYSVFVPDAPPGN